MKVTNLIRSCDFCGLLDPSIQFLLCQTNKVTYSTVKYKHFLSVLLCFTKIFGETGEEKYREYNEHRVNCSSERVRTKVLASFEAMIRAGIHFAF